MQPADGTLPQGLGVLSRGGLTHKGPGLYFQVLFPSLKLFFFSQFEA